MRITIDNKFLPDLLDGSRRLIIPSEISETETCELSIYREDGRHVANTLCLHLSSIQILGKKAGLFTKMNNQWFPYEGEIRSSLIKSIGFDSEDTFFNFFQLPFTGYLLEIEPLKLEDINPEISI